MEARDFQIQLLIEKIKDMQGRVFYREDDDGVLRRWTPPKPPKEETDT